MSAARAHKPTGPASAKPTRRRAPQMAGGALQAGSPVQADAAALTDLAASLEQALALLQQTGFSEAAARQPTAHEQATLLQQCLSLCEEYESLPADPVRIVEHLACTGGTLISKCLGLMPNVQLLSEIDPLSPIPYDAESPRFAPTDVNLLLQQGTRGADATSLQALFRAEVSVLYAQARRRGHHLVLRSHSHSHFCTGPAIPQRPTLREMVAQELRVRTIVTVRDPLDSYSALAEKAWLHFTPSDFAEYCRRYTAFLDAHEQSPVFRYEDFVGAPGPTMRAMCNALDLGFNPDFERLLSLMHLTGDSGRTSDEIALRPRRPSAEALRAAQADLPEYRALASRLGYTSR